MSSSNVLFVYGSLCRAELRYELLQRYIPARTAILNGYKPFWLGTEAYPGLRRLPVGRTKGQLLLRLSGRDLLRLDRYEGKRYRRVRCVPGYAHGRLPAWVYVLRASYAHELSWRQYQLMAEFL
jgi:gamma-glutamylcyclotransferase (GGCT)/AIG2-like uncharacterized protein YtfP